MDRVEADLLVLDLISHDGSIEYILGRLVGIDVRGADYRGE